MKQTSLPFLVLLITIACTRAFVAKPTSPHGRTKLESRVAADPQLRTKLEDHLKAYNAYLRAHQLDVTRDLGVQNYSCPGLMGKSKTVPTNANSVRPADINIIAALGDSLTAANGAGAEALDHLFTQYRGLAWAIGGDKNLETHATVPNVLLKYNPSLFGQSYGVGSQTTWSVAQLNAAVPGAKAPNLVDQARDLISKMQIHPQVNVQNDWKLINIFIGGNDVCDYCAQHESSPETAAALYASNIAQAVQILYDNLPRTIVSVMGLFQLNLLYTVDQEVPSCSTINVFECPCVGTDLYNETSIQKIVRAYQAAEKLLQTNGSFDQRDDFTLVLQPLVTDSSEPPRLPDGSIDVGFFAPDCFHFSQYGHAVTAKALWNNMLQPVGAKVTNYSSSDPTIPLSCPDPACPLIRTVKNSANCAQYLTPSEGK